MYWEKLAGVSFRQPEIGELTGDETLKLVAEPDNEYDVNAVRVEANGVLVGYIPKARNKEISDVILGGQTVSIDDWHRTGGTDGKTFGINVHIVMPISNQIKHMKRLVPAIGDGEIYFDERNHRYFTEDGVQMTSGSMFEDLHTPSPDMTFIAGKVANAVGLDKTAVSELWDVNGELSRDFGTLIHKALDFYITNKANIDQYIVNRELDNTATSVFPQVIGEIVDGYLSFVGGKLDNRETEVLVRSGLNCGRIDQLHYLDENTVNIVDYKITKGIKDVKTDDYGKLKKYTLQQNFYRQILEDNGLKVNEMVLHLYNGAEWEEVKLDRVDIKQ